MPRFYTLNPPQLSAGLINGVHVPAAPNTITLDLAQANRILILEDWCPVSVALNDNFLGINRSIARDLYAGKVRHLGDKSLLEGINELAYAVMMQGGNPDKIVMSSSQVTHLKLKSLNYHINTAVGRLSVVESTRPYHEDVIMYDSSNMKYDYEHNIYLCLAPWSLGRLIVGNTVPQPKAQAKAAPRCVCGSHDVPGPGHSPWCEIYGA